jgi:hypothetical protein
LKNFSGRRGKKFPFKPITPFLKLKIKIEDSVARLLPSPALRTEVTVHNPLSLLPAFLPDQTINNRFRAPASLFFQRPLADRWLKAFGPRPGSPLASDLNDLWLHISPPFFEVKIFPPKNFAKPRPLFFISWAYNFLKIKRNKNFAKKIALFLLCEVFRGKLIVKELAEKQIFCLSYLLKNHFFAVKRKKQFSLLRHDKQCFLI